MIRDVGVLLAVDGVGAAVIVLLLASWRIEPPAHPVLSMWLLYAFAAILLGVFIYSMVLTFSGRSRSVPFAERHMTEKLLWLGKGILIGGIGVYAAVVIVEHFYRS